MTSRIIAAVPSAQREFAEALISPLLVSPNGPGVYTLSVPLVSYPGPADSEDVIAYGCCSSSGPETVAALPSLVAAIPGSDAHAVDPREYSRQRDWIEWLQARGYQPYVPSAES